MPKICIKCHAENLEEAVFCLSCGTRFEDVPSELDKSGAPLQTPVPQDGGIPSISIPLPGGKDNSLAQAAETLPEPPAGEQDNPSDASQAEDEESGNKKITDPLFIDTPNLTASEKMSALVPGLIIAGRYKIISWMDEDGLIEMIAEDMLACWNCGADISPEMKWCDVCGSEISKFSHIHLVPDNGVASDVGIEWNGARYRVEKEPVAPLPAAPQPVVFQFGFASHEGMVREVDEDSVLVLSTTSLCEGLPAPAVSFFAVCDGIGGAAAGEIASKIAVQALAERLMETLFLPILKGEALLSETVVELLKQAVEYANQNILAYRQQNDLDMGCTLTCALLIGQQVWVANLGDSRTYLMRDDELQQISKDHSLVAGLLAAGMIEADDVFTHPQRNIILRSLGDKANVVVDVFAEVVLPGDRLLLCCDGLWEMVRPPEIIHTLTTLIDPQAASDELVRLANLAGGEDNISVIVINVNSAFRNSEKPKSDA
jgi:serine/threonine protein phosphatase PrpC/ribosomal protein L40E